MKKTITILYALLLLSLMPSCTGLFSEEQLNLAPTEDVNEEKIFTEYSLFRQFADYSYTYIPGHLGRLWNSMVSSMSDESRNKGGCSGLFNIGAWNGSVANDAKNELNDMWNNLYTGIRKANMIIENIDRVQDFPSDEIKQRYLGEAYFIRAFMYFELTKRWGGVPIVDRVLILSKDELDIPRSSYEDCVDFLVKDCDKAAGLLGLKYADADNGRATIGAALALKSRALLYAARPFHNPSGDISKWQDAADAAQAVIDLNQYTLYPDYTNLFFQPICDEVILNRPRSKMNFEQGATNGASFWVRFIATQGYDGWAGEWVTQNLVDKFEDANGYPITDPRSIYKENDPYSNRDPRLDMCVLRNDRYWYNRNLEFWVSADGKTTGKDKGTSNINVLGYAIAKFWPESHQRYKGTSAYMNYIFFRYAEILLNKAEALNEVEGPEAVRTTLTELRDRVGQVPIPVDISNTKETMRERIRNERAVELCFEEHRWYDVLSWHEGVNNFNVPIYGIYIVKAADGSFSYERVKYEDASFKEYMHLYPLPDEEVYKSQNLVQNPTW